MIRCSLSDAAEGMVLAKPILVEGRCLLNAGMSLTKKHLQIFKSWGISEFCIEGDDVVSAEDNGSNEPENQNPILEPVYSRFSKIEDTDGLLSMLKRLAVKLALHEMKSEKR